MAHVKYGVKTCEWWKHLRWMRRAQEKRTRQGGKRACALPTP